MTNKTELLPCPFCGSEALHYDNAYATCGKYRCPMNDVVVKNESWNTRAAPAEDVRAVGEEPVACRVRFIRGESPEVVSWNEQADGVHNFYRHPQRPVVLPECPEGYGHGGKWCGPEYNCWLDRRPEVNK